VGRASAGPEKYYDSSYYDAALAKLKGQSEMNSRRDVSAIVLCRSLILFTLALASVAQSAPERTHA